MNSCFITTFKGKINRDRGKGGGDLSDSSPPTPPRIRVRTCQFDGFKLMETAGLSVSVRATQASVSLLPTIPSFGDSPLPWLLCPLLTSVPRSRPLRTAQSSLGTRRRPPEVRPKAFTAHPPNLPPRPLMTVDFAIICPLVRPHRPLIQFLSIGSRLCYALPSDHASRHSPCASLILHRHQVV